MHVSRCGVSLRSLNLLKISWLSWRPAAGQKHTRTRRVRTVGGSCLLVLATAGCSAYCKLLPLHGGNSLSLQALLSVAGSFALARAVSLPHGCPATMRASQRLGSLAPGSPSNECKNPSRNSPDVSKTTRCNLCATSAAGARRERLSQGARFMKFRSAQAGF